MSATLALISAILVGLLAVLCPREGFQVSSVWSDKVLGSCCESRADGKGSIGTGVAALGLHFSLVPLAVFLS